MNRKNFKPWDLKESVVIHCNTQEKAIDLLKFLHEEGFTWGANENLLNHLGTWEYHSENTCYRVKPSDGRVSYSRLGFYQAKGFDIFEWEVFDMIKNRKTMEIAYLIDHGVAIHCDSEEKAKDFMAYIEAHGVFWRSGCRPIDENHWEVHHINTCYTLAPSMKVAYESLEYFQNEEYEIIEWEIADQICPSLELTTTEEKEEIILDGERLTESDQVNHPTHYTQYRVEVLDIIEDATRGVDGIEAVCLGNIIKYVLRYRFKNGVQDLKKARFYLDKLIDSLENKSK